MSAANRMGAMNPLPARERQDEACAVASGNGNVGVGTVQRSYKQRFRHQGVARWSLGFRYAKVHTDLEVSPLCDTGLINRDFAHLCPVLTVRRSLQQQLRTGERTAGNIHLADGEASLDRLILAGNFDVEVLAGQAEIVLGIVQLVAIHGADLLIRILSGLEIIEDQLAVGVSRTIHNLVARTIKEPVGDACQRLLGVSVHLENFDAAGDQLVLTSNFQNLPVLLQYNRKSRIIQLISIRCLKLLAGVAAQLQIGERQLTIGVRVALCGSASRCVVQTETGTLKRGVRVRVHLTDLYTAFPSALVRVAVIPMPKL